MRELDYVVLDLEEWCSNSDLTCDFCSSFENKGDRKIVCQIRTRSKLTGELIANDFVCKSCKERIGELPTCKRCGRLLTKSRYRNGKYVCRCIEYNENIEEKELPSLPHERESMATFYEKQINGLQEELNTAEVEIDTHLEALEISKDWHKRQKQELLDEISRLKVEVERLKKQTPQELINELNSCKEKIKALETQLEKLTSQQTTKVETPPKNGIKHFFKFGLK